MAQDYNIYIKTSGKNIRSNTKPKTANDSKTNAVSIINKTSSFLQNPDSLIGIAKTKAISSFAASSGAAGIAVAAVTAAYIIGTKVTDTIMPFITTTGDYRAQMTYNNVKTTVNAILHPVSTAINEALAQTKIDVYNQQQQQKSMLLGDSIINDMRKEI